MDYLATQSTLTDLLPVPEIATALGMSPKTLAGHLTKYRKQRGVTLRHRRQNSRYPVLAEWLDAQPEDQPLPTITQIAKTLDIPLSSTHRYLRTYSQMTGRTLIHKADPKEHPKQREIEEALKQGATAGEVRRSLGVSHRVVARVRSETGTQRRSSTLKVLEAITRFIKANGIPPTEAEVGRRLGMSSNTVSYHVRALVREGLVADPKSRAGLTLRGSQFREDCLLLARQTREGRGIPEALRPLVAAITFPVFGPDQRRVGGRDPRQRTAAYVEHLVARDGRPVTPVALAEVSSSTMEAARWALAQGVEFGVLRKERVGYLVNGPDRAHAAALRLQNATSQGWTPEAYEALQRVLKVVLAW